MTYDPWWWWCDDEVFWWHYDMYCVFVMIVLLYYCHIYSIVMILIWYWPFWNILKYCSCATYYHWFVILMTDTCCNPDDYDVFYTLYTYVFILKYTCYLMMIFCCCCYSAHWCYSSVWYHLYDTLLMIHSRWWWCDMMMRCIFILIQYIMILLWYDIWYSLMIFKYHCCLHHYCILYTFWYSRLWVWYWCIPDVAARRVDTDRLFYILRLFGITWVLHLPLHFMYWHYCVVVLEITYSYTCDDMIWLLLLWSLLMPIMMLWYACIPTWWLSAWYLWYRGCT